MGLIGGMARTAVAAGTWTAVSNRVSHRQAGRWANKQQAAAPAPQPQSQPQPQYAPPPQQYAPAPQYAQPQYVAVAPAAAPAAESTDDKLDQLQKLGELKAAGILTDAEFQAQKAKILAG